MGSIDILGLYEQICCGIGRRAIQFFLCLAFSDLGFRRDGLDITEWPERCVNGGCCVIVIDCIDSGWPQEAIQHLVSIELSTINHAIHCFRFVF